MPQPTFATSGGRYIVKFGNLPLPNGQGTLSNIDLNDRVHTFATIDYKSDDDNVQRGFAQQTYLAKGVWLYDDFGQRAITLSSYYVEDGSHFLGQFLASLSRAGEQQLTFDNLTYIPVKYAAASNRRFEKGTAAWFFDLSFLARVPWFADLSATTATPLNPITTDAGSNFNVTYAGSVTGEPVWTLHVPNTNAVVINSMQLKNTMSGEFLTVNFLSGAHGAIPASTTADIVIDCAAMTATQTQNGDTYDVSGSFPMLYEPAGQVNTFTAIITPASGSSSGLTLAYSVNPRWQI